jgi:hypothetical protein
VVRQLLENLGLSLLLRQQRALALQRLAPLKAMAIVTARTVQGAWQHMLRNVTAMAALRTGDGNEHERRPRIAANNAKLRELLRQYST